ncbi:hypothetical protein [Corynebacterium belfantii]|uniref:hypothetical protein n=1 Tax=Corynebacterium belfantii TaxID=2014537 RepID=UPI000B4BFFB3|nr:hypothetical protein [Corynebacterium belfantii]OWM36446.1 hypothetical protein AZF07_09965 [Corynebacterium diphtheriae subsp. lausannense]SNW31023.1 hypothetical protein FRC0043_00702 [Corynebacterium belfantii]
MATMHTVRVRDNWLAKEILAAGGMTALAEKLECNISTVSRQANGIAEAGPRFIGAVLAVFPIDFNDAFVVTTEEARKNRGLPSRRAQQPKRAGN